MNKFKKIYWIGGSPCAGKTSISKMLIKKYEFKLYRCDDYLDQHHKIGARRNYPIMSKLDKMDCDEIWMRDIDTQVYEEFEYYREEFKLILEELEDYPEDKNILVEGTAVLPELIEKMEIAKNRAVFMVPTAEFQLEHFKKRNFVQYVLEGCTDQEKAFENWMKRDVEFAKKIVEQVSSNERNLIVNDGSNSIERNFRKVEKWFELI